jgi:hypothetical protein
MKERIEVPSGTVTAVGLTLASGNDLSTGRIVFGKGSNFSGVDFRGWISGSPGGAAVSGACTYVGYAEGVLYFDINGDGGCTLKAGGSYYFNLALCASSAFDAYCDSPDAKAAAGRGIVIVAAYYNE